MMKKYRIGRVEAPWTNLEPPIRAAKPHSDSDLDEKTATKAADGRSRRSVDLSSVSFCPLHALPNVVRVCSIGIC
jgi:delta8-fatty-acid desaturase